MTIGTISKTVVSIKLDGPSKSRRIRGFINRAMANELQIIGQVLFEQHIHSFPDCSIFSNLFLKEFESKRQRKLVDIRKKKVKKSCNGNRKQFLYNDGIITMKECRLIKDKRSKEGTTLCKLYRIRNQSGENSKLGKIMRSSWMRRTQRQLSGVTRK